MELLQLIISKLIAACRPINAAPSLEFPDCFGRSLQCIGRAGAFGVVGDSSGVCESKGKAPTRDCGAFSDGEPLAIGLGLSPSAESTGRGLAGSLLRLRLRPWWRDCQILPCE